MTSGVPAEPVVVDAVTATVRELVACVNAGDLPRATALLTDEDVRRFLGGIDERNVAAITGTPTPLPPEQRAALVSVEDVRVLRVVGSAPSRE